MILSKVIGERIFAFLLLIAVLLALSILGDVFRSNIRLFLCIWLVLPILAIAIRIWELYDSKTLRTCRNWFMVAVVFISFSVFGEWDDIRNDIGRRYISGYRYWTEKREYDEGIKYEEDFQTSQPRGRRMLDSLHWVSVILVFALPTLTWKTFEAAISKRESEEEMEG